MAKKTVLFQAIYDDPRNRRIGFSTDHVCCIPNDNVIESIRAAGLTVYINGKKTSGKIPRNQLIDTAPCPIEKKSCANYMPV